ncbi:MAG: lytic transglycosylase domain-containing protein [Deltaproteobacteria bacterium]|jgi:soluble lytic murein transglycosylase-like protein|nr:lytic transglycosylase domain-containing protein [Deltaproteobacteria bacterium]
MRPSLIHALFEGVKLRSILALSAVSLAVFPAILEHRARLDNAMSVTEDAPAAPALPAEQGSAPQSIFSLTPNSGILDVVVSGVKGKPSFDRKARNYEEIIQEAATENSVSPALVRAVIQAESNFNPQAVSPQGAVGLMQILPSTARSMGFHSPQSPRENVRAGARYLKILLKEFGDEEALAVAAYNCGPDNVRRYGGQMPPFTETRVFVSQVMEYYQSHLDS